VIFDGFFFPIVTFIFCQAIFNLQFIYIRFKIAWQKIKVTIGKKNPIDYVAEMQIANEPESGFEPEPKTRKFGKFSNPEPVPDPESDFFIT
jgi:hypothetical protein